MRRIARVSLLLTLVACAPGVGVSPRAPDPQPADAAPEVRIRLEDTPHAQALSAVIRVIDPDTERHTITRSWRRNGEPSPFTSRTIPDSHTIAGDEWVLTVTASDGTSSTTATARARVTNEAPRLVGPRITPPRDTLTATSTLRFEYDELIDAEGDPARLTWTWLVDGAEAGTDGPLPASITRGKGQVVLRATTTDGIDQRITELGPVRLPQPVRAVDLVVAVDITGSTHKEYPGISTALRDLAARVRRVQGEHDRIGLVTFAWAFGYEFTPLHHVGSDRVEDESASWGELQHASRIRGASPDPDDGGLRPDMPREYDGEQGTDPHVGLRMARTMLTEEPHDDRFLAILLVTDGEPLPVGYSGVRDRIGYVEDRWRYVEGIVPHSSGDIEAATVAEAEAAWERDRISVFVVSVRDSAAFLNRSAQGHGTYLTAPQDDDVIEAFRDVVHALPWGGE